MSLEAILERKLRKHYESQFEDGGPGFACLVTVEGKALLQKGFGFRSVGGAALGVGTCFDLASVSKHFTAAAILLLVQEEKLQLEDELGSLLKHYKVKPKGRAATVQDLLRHVSGLPDYTGDAWDGSDEDFAELTTAEHVRWMSTQKAIRAPGKKYEYNNSGYALLAAVVEELAGQPYAQFMQQRFFGPLGMTRSLCLDSPKLVVRERATGYKTNEDEALEEALTPSVIQGDGNVFTCVDDLLRWELSLREATVLSEETLETAWTNGSLDDGSELEDEDGNGYGAGWVIESESVVSHAGSWAGTATYYHRDREQDVSIVVLSNLEDAETYEVVSLVGEVLELDLQ